MRYIYGSGGNILDLNSILQQLHPALKDVAQNASPILEGKPVFNEELVCIKKDEIYKCLFTQQDEEMAILTQQALELICAGMLFILERQAEEQLEGGSLSSPSKELKIQISDVPQHNMASERDFALFDNLLRFRPNATVLCIEAIILWVHNKPVKWLQSLPEDVKDQYFKEARENHSLIKGKLNERKQKIFKERKEKLELIAAEKKERVTKDCWRKQEIIDKILSIPGNLWKSSKAIDDNIILTESREQIEAVQTQLLYLRHVLEIKAKYAVLYQKTSKGKIFNLEEKVTHLKVLIKENEHVIVGNQQASTSLGKKLLTIDERESRFETEKLKVFDKVKHQRKNLKCYVLIQACLYGDTFSIKSKSLQMILLPGMQGLLKQ